MSAAAADIMAELTKAGMPTDVVDMLVTKFRESTEANLHEQFEAGLWSRVEKQKLVDFLEGVLHRQAGASPDVDELYQRKAELDRALLEDP